MEKKSCLGPIYHGPSWFVLGLYLEFPSTDQEQTKMGHDKLAQDKIFVLCQFTMAQDKIFSIGHPTSRQKRPFSPGGILN